MQHLVHGMVKRANKCINNADNSFKVLLMECLSNKAESLGLRKCDFLVQEALNSLTQGNYILRGTAQIFTIELGPTVKGFNDLVSVTLGPSNQSQ